MPPAPEPGPARCVALFQQYDYVSKAFQNANYGMGEEHSNPSPNISRQVSRLRAADCITSTDDLMGMEAVGAKLGPRQVVNSGAAIPPTAVHVGVLTSLSDGARAAAFFSGLGYHNRTIGAEQLGRRMYIGPFVSEGALAEAIAAAEAAGFVAPYATQSFHFWPW